MTKLGIRYYDPTLGRFTQPDPTGQDRHYTYARNNPVNFTDPSGAHTTEFQRRGGLDGQAVASSCFGGAAAGGLLGVVGGPPGVAYGIAGGCATGTVLELAAQTMVDEDYADYARLFGTLRDVGDLLRLGA